MTWTRVAALAAVIGIALVPLASGPPATADEPPASAAPPAAPAAWDSLIERGLQALRVRMEARLKEAELLERAGRLEEALAALRGVDRLYRETMEDLKALVGARGPAGAAPLPRGAPVPGMDVEPDLPGSELVEPGDFPDP